MSDHIAEASVLVDCPLLGRSVKVYSQLSTYGGVFIVGCNGCDNESGHPACIDCKVATERYWKKLHQQFPDRSASQLADPPPELPI